MARRKSLVQRGKNLAGAANPCLKSRLDVLVADVAMERCLRHELGRLIAHPAHYEMPSGSVELIRKVLEGVQASGINRRHVSEA